MNFKRSLLFSVLTLSAVAANAADKPGYFRAPALHHNSVVFTAEGDLWHSDINSGAAKRLTTHASEELMASISPDGKYVAYIANYEGNFEAYLMPISGGVPKRLTYENSRVRVQGWSPDGEVLYATDSGFGPANYWTLKTVNINNLHVTPIPLADAIEGTIDTDGKFIYFTRFGLQVTGDNSKVYRGGAQGQLWRYQLGSKHEAQLLTKQHQGSTREPMLFENRLYFISDASGNDNLWSMATDGTDIQQLTKHNDWQVRLADIHGDKIVYQLGADIKQYNIANGTDRLVDIALTSDFPQRQEKWLNDPLNYLNDASIAGNTDKVVITARGKLAVTGLHSNRLVEIDTPAKSRTRSAILANDGKWVYAINDSSGENEIWRFAADGSGNNKQLTTNGDSFRWNITLSPNGKYIAHDDREGNLWLLNLDKGSNKKIASMGSGFSAFKQVVWSADSKFIAFAGYHQQQERSNIRLYSLLNDKELQLTSDKYESNSPAFSRDGQWLYFLSERHFKSNPRSPWGDRNMGPAFDKRVQIFAYPLTTTAKFAFEQPNELNQLTHTKAETDSEKKSTKKNDADRGKPLWTQINNTLFQLPVPAGNYSALSANKSGLYLLEKNGANKDLKHLKFDNVSPKLSNFATDISAYQLASNGKKMVLVKKSADNNDIYIVKAADTAPKELNKAKVNSKHWQLAFSPMDEWQQMFQDAWLMHREFLFDKNMRGLDWAATKAKYQPLVDRVTARSELNDIFSQMMGELNALHSQVRGGDMPLDNEAAKASTLGARYQQLKSTVKISEIYQADAELPSHAAPLAKAGVNAKAGDIIVAINSKSINSIVEVHKALRNQAGKQVLLTLKRGKQTLKTIVQPITSRQDAKLRYLDWVHSNQQKVAKVANKDIGYLHMNAMTANDISSFAREFYANVNKDALIIDVRRNRGGNIDSWLIEKLLRKVWMYWQEGNSAAYSNMQQTFNGHLVVLTDQLTYSDGETFSAGIKSLGLAPLIGKQTTGAGVWLTGRNRLTDKGMARVAELPQYALDGTWVVEGTGVSPDIEVDNLPYTTYMGEDAQLTAGIEYLIEKLQQQPVDPFVKKPMPKTGPAADVKKIE
ncbi:S41 family peptidase [Thalassotalea sp. ND16A]|uniref:S41 family peptidase n=1 Tax=Thalassotalea sp. ND16A TaxID=1535422 RepID=UPI00051A7BCA|nr:S41 family peptidase [Thalassotalea sp. ND16A]KGJ93472.1 hypothetical protein ND16A_1489 [Thalassotalea sp. ND16A]